MTATAIDINTRLRRILAIHFDPQHGTPYWLERQQHLGLDVIEQIDTIEDLSILGHMDEIAMANRPVEDFIPRRFHGNHDYLIAETAGTLARPKFAVHRDDEFLTAFVTPFLKAAEAVAFPKNTHWLFVGPTGPHIIGRAARRCARASGSADVFTVDFDPRWAKKLPAGSLAAKRYLHHIIDQALHVLDVQQIGVLFATPAVLTDLAGKMDESKRLLIRGIHLGGMSAGAEFMDTIAECFPNAVILSGYGNTLFGMMPQLRYDRDSGFDYFAYGDRLVVRVIDATIEDAEPNIESLVEYGARGQVMVHRLDEMQFLPNCVERDSAIRTKADGEMVSDGFASDGLRDPQPIINATVKPVIGLY